MSSNFQDWAPVRWDKTGKVDKNVSKDKLVNQARRSGQEVVVEKKFLGGQNRPTVANAGSAKKIEEDTGDYHVDRVCTDFCKALQKARLAKNMTQADLAKAINEKPVVVNEYESGKAIPNGAVIQKMNRVLGVNLPKSKAPKPREV